MLQMWELLSWIFMIVVITVSCSRVLLVAMMIWLRQRGMSPRHWTLQSRLAGWLVFSMARALDSGAEQFMAREPGQWGSVWRQQRGTPVPPQNYQSNEETKKQRNEQLDISSQGPMNRVSVFVNVWFSNYRNINTIELHANYCIVSWNN